MASGYQLTKGVDSLTPEVLAAALQSLSMWVPVMDGQLVQWATQVTAPGNRLYRPPAAPGTGGAAVPAARPAAVAPGFGEQLGIPPQVWAGMPAARRAILAELIGPDFAAAMAAQAAPLVGDGARERADGAAPGAGGGAGGAGGAAPVGSAPGGGAFEIDEKTLSIAEDEAIAFDSLSGVSDADLRLRFSLLKMFNSLLARVLPMLDVLNSKSTWSLGCGAYFSLCVGGAEHLYGAVVRRSKLRKLNHCIFVDSKAVLMNAVLEKTWSKPDGTGWSLELNNGSAFESLSMAEKDPAARNPAVSKCIFMQVCVMCVVRA